MLKTHVSCWHRRKAEPYFSVRLRDGEISILFWSGSRRWHPAWASEGAPFRPPRPAYPPTGWRQRKRVFQRGRPANGPATPGPRALQL